VLLARWPGCRASCPKAIHREDRLRTYEVMFIAAPNTVDDDLRKLTTQLESVVSEQGGRVTKSENLGRRKLAYRIEKYDEGIYSLLNIEGSGREMAEVDRRLRVSDMVIRHISVRTDEDIRRAEKMRARRKPQSARQQGEPASEIDIEDEEPAEE
jgi:small subunit ribosomal protein S6